MLVTLQGFSNVSQAHFNVGCPFYTINDLCGIRILESMTSPAPLSTRPRLLPKFCSNSWCKKNNTKCLFTKVQSWSNSHAMWFGKHLDIVRLSWLPLSTFYLSIIFFKFSQLSLQKIHSDFVTSRHAFIASNCIKICFMDVDIGI